VGGRITVYNLGEQGVNLTKSPLHQSDGELLQSQNAIRSLNNVDGGLVKREALTTLTSPAMDGSVRGLISLPLPNPLGTATFWIFQQLAGSEPVWSTMKSVGGTTWALDLTNALEAGASPSVYEPGLRGNYTNNLRAALLPRKRRFYYFGNTDGEDPGALGGLTYPPPIWSYDGTTNRLVGRLPSNPDADTDQGVWEGTDMIVVGSLLYIATGDGRGSSGNQIYGSVYLLDENGMLTLVGRHGELQGAVAALCWHENKLWAGTGQQNPTGFGGAASGDVYYIRPFLDTSWSSDSGFSLTFTDERMVSSMAAFEGSLYVSTRAVAGTAAKIRKRAPGGSWTTVYTSSHSTAANGITNLTVYDSALYALQIDDLTAVTGYTQKDVLRTEDGSSWSVDLDISASIDPVAGGSHGPFLVIGSDLYLSGAHTIIRRRAGSWTEIDTTGGGMGVIGYIRAKN
jgi:hypothetical protein